MLFDDFKLEMFLRPLAACVLGAVIGWNRELKKHPAGLRTQILVALGSCSFTLSALELTNVMREQYLQENSDPVRVIAGIVGGIGFLGAGSIIQSGGDVRGVTTAATVWVTGAIGIACGMGAYTLALVTAGLTAFVLIPLGRLEQKYLQDQ